MRHASFARADRVTPRSAAIASMLAMSESGNQNEITRPAMGRHIRFALALSSTALVLAACGHADPHVIDSIQACLDRGGDPHYIENGFTGRPTEYLFCEPAGR